MKGFTIIEILIIIVVSITLLGLTLMSFNNLNASRALDGSTLLVVSVLNQARIQTLASKDNTQYGVHFDNSSAILFKGDTYSPVSSDNVVVNIHSQASISNINLTGGGSDVVFERLTGKTAQNGVITLSLNSNPSNSRTLSVYLTGLVQAN
jgi:Tfp pilus assembly protein FimT